MPRMSVIREVLVRVLEDEMRLYRATWGDGDPAQLESFRSHYELQRPPRGPEVRAAVIHMAVSMFETAEPCWGLIDRTKGPDRRPRRRVALGSRRCEDGRAAPLVGLGRSRRAASSRERVRRQVEPADILRQTMTYSIFTSTGNLVDAFDDRDAAVAALTDIVRAEPESADEVFLVAQDDDGHVGETIYGSSLHVMA